MRERIPVDQYLHILHTAALTGELPIYDLQSGTIRLDEHGAPVTSQIEDKERLNILKYLVDKRMPTVKQVALHETGGDEDNAKDERTIDTVTLQNKTSDELREILRRRKEVPASHDADEEAVVDTGVWE